MTLALKEENFQGARFNKDLTRVSRRGKEPQTLPTSDHTIHTFLSFSLIPMPPTQNPRKAKATKPFGVSDACWGHPYQPLTSA